MDARRHLLFLNTREKRHEHKGSNETDVSYTHLNGDLSTKSYSSARELFAELDEEMDNE